MFNPTWIRGKKIAEVRMNYFADGRGGMVADPTIVFEDGSKICFIARETEVAAYGIDILYMKRPVRGRSLPGGEK